MICPSCNTETGSNSTFCPHCGANTATGAPPAAIPAQQGGLSETAAGAIAYITIIPAIIFLVAEPYNKNRFIRFHAWQNVFLCVGAFVGWIALFVASAVLAFIPILGHLVAFLLWAALSVGLFVGWIMALIKANQGQMYKLPVIGDMAEKQANAA